MQSRKLLLVKVQLLMLIIPSFCSRKMEEISLKVGLGILIGKTESVVFDGIENKVTKFLGIPYAKPPVNERRFSRPEPYGGFEAPYNATYHRPHCLQERGYQYVRHFEKSEDCLYLNIFIPGTATAAALNRYPVMIYIHGGGFFTGGADVYAGDILSSFNNVIVVTLNYRLSVFGFLSTGEDFSGNYGLWDMKLAIQWVHDNIQEFGGDITKVTLFGNSAGGAAVQYQAINPSNEGLFQRIISQSGSCFAFWAFQSNPTSMFENFVSDVGCNKSEFSDIMNCLREKDTDSLLDSVERQKQHDKFVPTIDNDFLPEDPISLLNQGSENGERAMTFFSGLDLLNGVQNYDGGYAWIYYDMKSFMSKTNFDIAVERLLTRINRYKSRGKMMEIPSVLLESVIYQYTDWSSDSDQLERVEKMLQLESDITFFVPTTLASNTHSKSQITKTNNSYFYVFAQKPDFAPKPDWLKGATHFMEMPYVLGLTKELIIELIEDYVVPEPFIVSDRDIEFSKLMMRIWTNFAKTGNPNLMDSDFRRYFPTWPPYNGETQMYLELSYNTTASSVKNKFARSSVAYWENVVPLLMECGTGASSKGDVQTPELRLLILTVMYVLITMNK